MPLATPSATTPPTARPLTPTAAATDTGLTPPTPTALPTTTPLPAEQTQYTLDAQLDYTAHTLEVTEVVSYTNTTTETLEALLFVVEANLFPGAFRLGMVTWADGRQAAGVSLSGRELRIPLAAPLAAGSRLTLKITYSLILPPIPPPSETTRPQVFGYTQRQTNLVDWYAFLPPYRPGQGWLVHEPWFYGETLVYDVADYRVLLSRSDTTPPVTVAASAPAQFDGSTYRYQFEDARSFALSIGSEYHVFSETVGAVTVYSYAFPYHTVGAKAALQDTARALALYSELFGAYLHTSLSVVEADFLDGMEFDGLYFLSNGFYNLYDGSPRGYLTMIAAHETAHQWWYGRVGNDQALEPWLDEALCTYSERLFYERYYADMLAWWRYFRIDYYEPTGWVNRGVYAYQGFLPYRNAVYLRGALFLEDLRVRMGDEAFLAFLREYATRYDGKQATAADFFGLLAIYSPTDISDVVATYFEP